MTKKAMSKTQHKRPLRLVRTRNERITPESSKDGFAQQQGFKNWTDYQTFMFNTGVTASKKVLAWHGAMEFHANAISADLLRERDELKNRIDSLNDFHTDEIRTLQSLNSELLEALKEIQNLESPDTAKILNITSKLIAKCEGRDNGNR